MNQTEKYNIKVLRESVAAKKRELHELEDALEKAISKCDYRKGEWCTYDGRFVGINRCIGSCCNRIPL